VCVCVRVDVYVGRPRVEADMWWMPRPLLRPRGASARTAEWAHLKRIGIIGGEVGASPFPPCPWHEAPRGPSSTGTGGSARAWWGPWRGCGGSPRSPRRTRRRFRTSPALLQPSHQPVSAGREVLLSADGGGTARPTNDLCEWHINMRTHLAMRRARGASESAEFPRSPIWSRTGKQDSRGRPGRILVSLLYG
jgi:hypothetical protein